MKNNKNEKKKVKKPHRLLFQVGVSVVVFFFIAIAVSSIVVYKKAKEMYLESKRGSFGAGIFAAHFQHESSEAEYYHDFYPDYAIEHIDYLKDFSDKTVNDFDFHALYSLAKGIGKNIYEINQEEFMSLPEKERNYLTAYYACYEKEFLTGLEMMLEYENVSFLSMPDETSDDILVIKANDISVRNVTDIISKSDVESIRNGNMDPFYRITDSDTVKNAYYTCFLPVENNTTGKVAGIISFSYDYHGFRKGAIKKALSTLILSGSALIISAILILIHVRKKAIRPLERIQNSVTDYISDNDANTLIASLENEKARNEVGLLARDLARMAAEMERQSEENIKLAEEKAATESELKLAARIQTGALPGVFPPFPDRTEFEIYASMDPAKDVGGDYYDFFMIDRDHLGLVIADVSGKGIPAALFMMMSKQLIRQNAMETHKPEEVLFRTNNQLFLDNPDGMFVTVWIGILEISTGKLTASNAGHEYPAIYRNGKKFELLKDKHGLFLGGLPESKYETYEIQLEKGDMLFVYTDGVPEAKKKTGEFFKISGMMDSLNEIGDATPEEVLRHVRASLNAFVGDADQYDDITMLALKYNG